MESLNLRWFPLLVRIGPDDELLEAYEGLAISSARTASHSSRIAAYRQRFALRSEPRLRRRSSTWL